MKIISEEQEDADDFGNTNHPHLNGAAAAAASGNCKASNGEGRKPAAENTCKAANGTVAKVESVSAVNGDSSLPVIVRKKKKATRTNTLDGGCSSEKERFARIGYL